MREGRLALIVGLFLLAAPSAALAADGGTVTEAVLTGSGVVALLVAAALLIEMLMLRRLAEGAAIVDNITYAILAVICLTASTLAGWTSRFLPLGFTSGQARLGTDLLAIAAMVLFGIYFMRVRRAMSRFLGQLSGEAQNLISVLDADGDLRLDKDGHVG